MVQGNDGKTSGRSHETSTFQQNHEMLESLKEIGEENEEDDEGEKSNQKQGKLEEYNFTMNKEKTDRYQNYRQNADNS